MHADKRKQEWIDKHMARAHELAIESANRAHERPANPEQAWEWLREAVTQLRDLGYVGTADEAEAALSVLWLAYEEAVSRV